MEFSYKLTELDYLAACQIVIKPIGRFSPRTLLYAYLFGIWLAVWGALFTGMYLELSDLNGVFVTIHKLPPVSQVFLASLFPSFIYAFGLLVVVRAVLRRWYSKRRRRHFRSDPSCQAETTIKVTKEGVEFRSEIGTSKSVWACYKTWTERSGILLLVTCAGIRKIIKTAGLSDLQRDELRSILTAALPKK